jgi:hypothetical protein
MPYLKGGDNIVSEIQPRGDQRQSCVRGIKGSKKPSGQQGGKNGRWIGAYAAPKSWEINFP